MMLLIDALDLLSMDNLKSIGHYLSDMPRTGPKQKLLDFFHQLLSGAPLRTTWQLLDDTQRLAMAEAVHDPLGRFSDNRFYAKYGRPPGFFEPRPEGLRPWDRWHGKPTALSLFLFRGLDDNYEVPGDLRQELLAFVPQPAPLAVPVCKTLPQQCHGHTLTVRTSEGEALTGGDFYPAAQSGSSNLADAPAGPIKAFAWPSLRQAAGLMQRQGNKSALTPRRHAVEAALKDCPVGAWVEVDQLSRYMVASGRSFEVTHDIWKLYIGTPNDGCLGYDDSNIWDFLQLRYLLCLLFEYATPLGLVDLAYVPPGGARPDYSRGGRWTPNDLPFLSRYDGLCHIRLTALGAYCLSLADTYTPASALAVEEALMLETWAAPLAAQSWQLHRGERHLVVRSEHQARFRSAARVLGFGMPPG